MGLGSFLDISLVDAHQARDDAKRRLLPAGIPWSRPAEVAQKGNLIHLLPPRPKLQRGHMPAMPYAQIPDFMKRLSANQSMSARALEYTVQSVARKTMTLEDLGRNQRRSLGSLREPHEGARLPPAAVDWGAGG